jgi:integrase/recombinase XerC
MLDETEGPRDVSQLLLPGLGHVGRDEHGAWQVYGPDGTAVSAVTWFLADLSASDCADSTCRSYAYDVLRWLRFLTAVDVEWQQATRREVRDFVRWFGLAPNPQRDRSRQHGRRPPAGTLNSRTGKAYLGSGYASRTINHALSVVSEFYSFAVQAGLGPLHNPVPTGMRDVDPAGLARRRRAALRQKEPQRQPRDVPEELLQQIVTALTCARDRALVAVAVGAGMRAGELLSMTCGGLDAGRGVLSVIPKGGTVPLWVPAPPEAFVEISRYLLTRKPGGQSDPLWLTLRSPIRPLTYFTLRQVLERINDRLGTNISWHDLRHTFTHRLLNDNGIGLSDVQQLLRHRDLSTLSAYSTSRVDELVKHLRAHEARPKPELSAADGYDTAALRTLFPGLMFPSPGETAQ